MSTPANGTAVMNDPIIAAFDALRERLATPEQWTQGAPARDAAGAEVHPNHFSARSRNLIGALHSLYLPTRDTAVVFHWLVSACPHPSPTVWAGKSERTHAEVLDLIDRAKARYLAEAS